MNNEPNKPIPAQELTEKELEGIVGGVMNLTIEEEFQKSKMDEYQGAGASMFDEWTAKGIYWHQCS